MKKSLIIGAGALIIGNTEVRAVDLSETTALAEKNKALIAEICKLPGVQEHMVRPAEVCEISTNNGKTWTALEKFLAAGGSLVAAGAAAYVIRRRKTTVSPKTPTDVADAPEASVFDNDTGDIVQDIEPEVVTQEGQHDGVDLGLLKMMNWSNGAHEYVRKQTDHSFARIRVKLLGRFELVVTSFQKWLDENVEEEISLPDSIPTLYDFAMSLEPMDEMRGFIDEIARIKNKSDELDFLIGKMDECSDHIKVRSESIEPQPAFEKGIYSDIAYLNRELFALEESIDVIEGTSEPVIISTDITEALLMGNVDFPLESEVSSPEMQVLDFNISESAPVEPISVQVSEEEVVPFVAETLEIPSEPALTEAIVEQVESQWEGISTAAENEPIPSLITREVEIFVSTQTKMGVSPGVLESKFKLSKKDTKRLLQELQDAQIIGEKSKNYYPVL